MTTHKPTQTELLELIERGAQLALDRREGELSEQELAAASGGASISSTFDIKGGIAGRYEVLQGIAIPQIDQLAGLKQL